VGEETCQCGFGEEYFTIDDGRNLVMPGQIDGFQAPGVIKTMDERLPVLVLTSSPPTKELLKKLGSQRAKKYLNKASKDLEGLFLKNPSSL
jgi:hypothetical protein